MTSQHKAVAEAALKIADAVAGAEEYTLALDLCESARSSAQKARQYPLVKELAAKSEDFQKRQRAFQEYQAAWALMKDDPVEPAANLTAGRYQCFVKGDWAWGVPMLALGSDKTLKDASLMELRQANSAEQQAAIGDAWWDAAERLLRGTNLVEKPYLANVPSDGRMAALVKDLDTLLGKWHRRNTNSAYEAIWTFYDDGTGVVSARKIP